MFQYDFYKNIKYKSIVDKMQFRKGKELEQMPTSMGGLQYNKNYVARSRMEELLNEEDGG